MEVEESKYFEESITWSKTLDAEFPYEAVHGGKILKLKVNDFPEEHLYSLLQDNDEIATFDDWPRNWIRGEANENEVTWQVEESNAKIQSQVGMPSFFIGRSRKMQALYQMIEMVAQAQSTVLVTGESGTGKELVARAIHDLSPRAAQPFVAISCGAMTETFLEAELFGHVKGAFTGADTDRKGLFEAANRGTILLDDISEIFPAIQVKLLRLLQERKLRRLGSTEETFADIRVIAATNRDLIPLVKDGTFREDLYYRLSVIPITLPSLRERPEDIKELAQHFVEKSAARTGRTLSISATALRLLEHYDWPGNIRELENAIERAVVMETGDSIRPESLPERITKHSYQIPAQSFELWEEDLNLLTQLDILERNYVVEALRRASGNQSQAAILLGISGRSLRYLLEKHGISRLKDRDQGRADFRAS